MTAKEKAIEIYEKYYSTFYDYPYFDHHQVILACRMHIEGIIEALFQYGDYSNEIQNMDSEFRFWFGVKRELEKL